MDQDRELRKKLQHEREFARKRRDFLKTAGGNIDCAGEAYDEELWSYMDGAISSGERVAREIQQNY